MSDRRKIRMTDRWLANIALPEHGSPQVTYLDELSPAALRVSYGGAKSWVVHARVLRRGTWQPSRVTLGRWPALRLADAREKAKQALQLAQEGKDPRTIAKGDRADLERKSRDTFDRLVDDFLTMHVRRRKRATRTEAEYKRVLKGPDVAEWKDRPISSITKRDVIEVLDKIVDRGAPVAANRTRAYLGKFFRWLAGRDVIEASPVVSVERPSSETSRDRALTPTEIPEVVAAFKQLGYPFGPLFELLLLTGQRRGEIAGMDRDDELSDLDGNEPEWTIPGNRTKNKRPQLVPLAPQAVALIKGCDPIGKSPLVFTITGKTPVSGFSKAKAEVDQYIAAARKEAGVTKTMPAWTLHDLRRTVSTRMHEDLGIQPHIVEAVLNHISGHKKGPAGTYNKALYREEKRKALTAWADYLDKLTATPREDA